MAKEEKRSRLQTKQGRNISFKIDPASEERINHLLEFTERVLGLRATKAVIVRRALMLLVEHCDGLTPLTHDPTEGHQELLEDERYSLKHAAEGSNMKNLIPIPTTAKFKTWEERCSDLQEEFRKGFLDSISTKFNQRERR